MQVKGTISIVSEKTKGFVLKEQPTNWYNPVNELKPKISKALKGCQVTLTISQNPFEVTAIEVTSQPAQAQATSTSTSPRLANQYDGARVGMAINNATLRVNSLPMYNNDTKWAEAVVRYAKALLEEMDKGGLR